MHGGILSVQTGKFHCRGELESCGDCRSKKDEICALLRKIERFENSETSAASKNYKN